MIIYGFSWGNGGTWEEGEGKRRSGEVEEWRSGGVEENGTLLSKNVGAPNVPQRCICQG